MTVPYRVCVAGLLGCVAVCSVAQDPVPQVKHALAAVTSPASGREMFMSYCAACHGKDAKGNGPAATALNVAPADLTALAKKNGGKFPSDRVATVLNGQANLAAHGNKEMPVWGPIFWRMSGGHEGEVQQRIANLSHYLESVQQE